MDSLDTPLHQLILNDLATNVAEDPCAAHEDVCLITDAAGPSKRKVERVSKGGPKTVMAAALVRSNIAFCLSTSSLFARIHPSSSADAHPHLEPLLRTLSSLLVSLPSTAFEEAVGTWGAEWCLPDQLAFAVTAALIRVADRAPWWRADALESIFGFLHQVGDGLRGNDAHRITTAHVPLFHGFYRAITSVPFAWSLSEFGRIIDLTKPLLEPKRVARLDSMLLLQQPLSSRPFGAAAETVDGGHSGGAAAGDEEREEEEEEDRRIYRSNLLARYRALGRPLSGHFVLCGLVETWSTVLAQALVDGENVQRALSAPLDRPEPGPGTPLSPSAEPFTPLGLSAVSPAPQDSYFPISPSSTTPSASHFPPPALAASLAWSRLLASPAPLITQHAPESVVTTSTMKEIKHALKDVQDAVLSAFEELLEFVENVVGFSPSAPGLGVGVGVGVAGWDGLGAGADVAGDVYPLEIMSESLKLAALCSVTLRTADSELMTRIRLLLSENAPVYDVVVQGAALQAVNLLVLNLTTLAMPMTQHLRRFATSPLPIFETDPATGTYTPPLLTVAAKCLARCVKIAPGDDLMMSTMYSLLNYLSKDVQGGSSASGATTSSIASAGAQSVAGASTAFNPTASVHTGSSPSSTGHGPLQTDDQKRQVQISTVSLVSALALEFGNDEIIMLAISMLLQRLRTTDRLAEGAILANLVLLALDAPMQSFTDVIKAFSQVSRASGAVDPRYHSVPVLMAQTMLAKGLEGDDNKDKQEAYLVELLQLFEYKGMQLQELSASQKHGKQEITALTNDLAALLPVIDTLLSHEELEPHVDPSPEVVSMFRNMWFLSVLFGFADEKSPPAAAAAAAAAAPDSVASSLELHTDSLQRIALKTPALVPETAHNYLESDLEYNSVLRRDFSSVTLSAQRQALTAVIPSHAHEIRYFSLAQVTFLLTIYRLEVMRSDMGRPSMMLWYFVNEGVNDSSLIGCMEAVADKVITSVLSDLSRQVECHSLDPQIISELEQFLLGSCHRSKKVRHVSLKYLDRLFGAYPSLLCETTLVVCLLEILTLLRKACEGEYNDEYTPQYSFASSRADISFDLSDNYAERNEILTQLHQRARGWLASVMDRAPVELQGILQRYLGTVDDETLPGTNELGASIAVDFARFIPASARKDTFLPQLGGWRADASSSFVGELAAKSNYLGEMTGIHLALSQGLFELQKDPSTTVSPSNVSAVKNHLSRLMNAFQTKKASLPLAELRRLLYRCAAIVVALPQADFELLHYVVAIPIRVFTPSALTVASHVWTWMIGERPEMETKIMVEISAGWTWSVKNKRGLFSPALNYKHPLVQKTEFTAVDRSVIDKNEEAARKLLAPHLTLLQMISSRYQAFRYRDPSMVLALIRLIQRSAEMVDSMSTHPLAREVRFSLVVFGFKVLQGSRLEVLIEFQLREALYNIALAWFRVKPQWSYGSNRLQVRSEMQLMQDLLEVLHADRVKAGYSVTSYSPESARSTFPGGPSPESAPAYFNDRERLLQLLVENELSRFSVWYNPLQDASRGQDFKGEVEKSMNEVSWLRMIQTAWRIDPRLVVFFPDRFKIPSVLNEVTRLIRSEPAKVRDVPEGLPLLLGGNLSGKEKLDLKPLLYWAPVPPVTALMLFQPQYGNHPLILQYAMRVLEQHPVELTFFYVPQVVQALRQDAYGYVERFIFETAKISQLFCHQIIWNMKANCYKDDNAEEPDPMKPMLDRLVDMIVNSLSGEAKDFYEREFSFFNEVTSISGKLKPYIKKSKAEKKASLCQGSQLEAKIDEEMAKIKVDPGVYLPSNPDGTVVGLDRKSGRPLQSHAKAPFMATFKVHREIEEPTTEEVMIEGETGPDGAQELKRKGLDVWQAAIFKVGDDCRQDVLALQMIAMFKNIFISVGLDLYLNPYRVTATAPGCGVIDVVPNATSRDEMGRAKVNNLYTFFVTKFGNPTTIAFQKARLNFIQSMAAYSLCCYILQIKDRHNGNIMIDADGHIVHVDFGFLFDIGPGGIKFEPNSFKLSHEMVEVMGGDQGFRMFSELLVKAFLACRPYADQIIDAVHLMLGTGLPSFKGEGTIKRLRDRFQLQLNERQAAVHMQKVIRNALENVRSVAYDSFQRWQNGIPY